MKDQADKIPEKAHELAAKIQPAAEQLGDKIEQGAHKVALPPPLSKVMLSTHPTVVYLTSIPDIQLQARAMKAYSSTPDVAPAIYADL